MPLFTTDTMEKGAGAAGVPDAMTPSRIERLKKAVQEAKPGVCTERACLWTVYHRRRGNRSKPPFIQMAEALRSVLREKTVTIYPDERIVGNFSSKRVGGSIYPELHGIPVLLDIFFFSRRKTNPLQISGKEIWKLLTIVPFWAFRFMALKAYASPAKTLRLVVHQLRGHFYIINESGGISHIAPDYEKLIQIGTEGIAAEALEQQEKVSPRSEEWLFYEAVRIAADGLAIFGDRYAQLAEKLARAENNPVRKRELSEIAAVCSSVPRRGASTFHEALQSLFFAQIAVNMESLDNSVCPGRIDQYLYPFYRRDLEKGRITREKAKELLAAFSIKMSEIIPVFSNYLTKIHGGMFNGQVVTVGGVDRRGEDAANDLSFLLLEIMDELRMRQPNFHARVSSLSPRDYVNKIHRILANGSNSPALYNDDVIVETMCRHGYSVEDARDYTAVGCVEPVSQGKSFSSTDAALVNVPIMLELALNQGKRFGSLLQSGCKTKPVEEMRSMADVTEAFRSQMQYQIDGLLTDLRAIELANRRHHPTPLTSSLLDGCLRSGKCSTAGGATYNFSGIQCVAPADTGDALYAIEKTVFVDRRFTLPYLVAQLKANLEDRKMRDYLRGLSKFGNDEETVDRWVLYVVESFLYALRGRKNSRGGKYVVGLYSVTTHEFYGQVTGAMPNGRRKGESFASGIAPANGMDRSGPTAMFNSVNRFDFTKIANGINLNVTLDRQLMRGERGEAALAALLRTYFKNGGMQVQVNALDSQMLKKARRNPHLYPHLLVRVSGYSAYFNDLTPEMKDEIIQRSTIAA